MMNLAYPVGPRGLFVSCVVCTTMLCVAGCECRCADGGLESARVSTTTSEPLNEASAQAKPGEGIETGIDRDVDGDADMTLVQQPRNVSTSASR